MLSGGRPRATAPRRLVSAAAVVVLATVIGLELHDLPRLPVGAWLVAGPALLVLGFALLQGPRWCLAVLIAVDIFGLYKVGRSIGPVNLRLIDIPYVALVASVLVQRAREGPLPRPRLGQRAIGLWLIAVGVSLYPLAVHAPGSATSAVVEWLRLVQTLSLVWLVPYALRKLHDLEAVLGVIALAIALEIGGSSLNVLIHGGVNARFRLSGGVGANTSGLLAALLVLMSFHSPVPRRRWLRVAMLVVGVTGLVLAKSLGGIAAAGVALAVFGFRGPAVGRSRRAGMLMPTRLLLVALAAVALGVAVKGENFPGSPRFGGSSTMQRTMLATAGLELFADHPLTGVGWHSAPSPAEARHINDRLKRLFGKDVNPQFYPEVTMPNYIAVHNTYVQIPAETGLLGFGLFIVAAFAAARGIRTVLSNARARPEVYASAHCVLVLLVATLVWFNDNTLFGAQPETVLVATFFGMLSAVPLLLQSAAGASGPEMGNRPPASTELGR